MTTYTAPGAQTFRLTGGDLDKKITDQLALIDSKLDELDTTNTGTASALAGGEAGGLQFT